jgi:hypothetical protein
MRPSVRFAAILGTAAMLIGALPMPSVATAQERLRDCPAEEVHHGKHEPRARVALQGVGRDRTVKAGSRFTADRVNDLLVTVQWKFVEDDLVQRIHLIAPDGAVYQRMAVPIPENRKTETRVPVAGTWITQHSLYGAWCVEVFLDGVPEPVARRGFVLNPSR